MPEIPHDERINVRKEKTNRWIIGTDYIVDRKRRGMFDPSVIDPFEIGDYINNIEEYILEKGAIKDKLFVDVGSGVGSLAHEAVGKLGAYIINLDIAESAVRYLKDTNGELGIVGDAFNLPFSDELLDGLISANFTNSSVIDDGNGEYAQNMRDFLLEVVRILKPNGLFVQSNFGASEEVREALIQLCGEAGLTDLKEIGRLMKVGPRRSYTKTCGEAGRDRSLSLLGSRDNAIRPRPWCGRWGQICPS